jgi:hypothetical protein
MNRRKFLKLFGGLLSVGLIPSTLIEANAPPAPAIPDPFPLDSDPRFCNWREISYDAVNQVGRTRGSHIHDLQRYALMPTEYISKAEFKKRYPKGG